MFPDQHGSSAVPTKTSQSPVRRGMMGRMTVEPLAVYRADVGSIRFGELRLGAKDVPDYGVCFQIRGVGGLWRLLQVRRPLLQTSPNGSRCDRRWPGNARR